MKAKGALPVFASEIVRTTKARKRLRLRDNSSGTEALRPMPFLVHALQLRSQKRS